MLYINDDIVAITKGDDAVLDITIHKSDGTDFVMESTDTLTLSVKERPCCNYPVLLQSMSAPGSNRIVLTGNATAAMCPGRYSYDVQLNRANGDRFTIIPDNPDIGGNGSTNNWNNFIVMGEVTVP